MRLHKSTKDILNGNIPEQVLLFTIPTFGAYLLQQVYQFVDSIVLGRYAGVEALAAVGGSAAMIINVLVSIITGVAAGLMIVVAQNYGRGDTKRVHSAVKTGMFIAIVFGGALSVLSAVIAKPLLIIMKCPEDTLTQSLIYIYSYFIGLVPYIIYNFGMYTLRATGDTKISLFFTVIIVVVKIVLDILLTAILKIGIWGVSISTIASYVVCSIVVLIILYKTPHAYHYDIKKFGYDKNDLFEIFKIGVPIAIQSGVFAITNAYVSVKINEFGTNSIAAFSAYTNVDNLYWSFTNAIGAAVITIVGQNYGNKNLLRVRQTLKHSSIIHFIVTIMYGFFDFFLGESIIKLFTTDPVVVEIATNMIKMICITYSTYMLVEMISSTLKGCGDSVNSMLLAVIGTCVVRLSYLTFVNFKNVYQVMLCYPFSWAVTTIMYVIYYFAVARKKLTQNN